MSTRTLSNLFVRTPVLAAGIALLCTMFPTTASAQRHDKGTTVTFSGPVEIPGPSAQVLPAGTYLFKLFDSTADRNVVQVFSQDGTHLFATILAVPNYRLHATDKTVITFAERTSGQPQAIRAWFYPGDTWGQEFVYPKSRAVALAAVTQQPVLYIPDDVAPNIVAPATKPDEAPVVALKTAPVMAVAPTGDDVDVSAVVAATPAAPMAKTLPKTAGSLPLLALIGALCLGFGLSLGASRRLLWTR